MKPICILLAATIFFLSSALGRSQVTSPTPGEATAQQPTTASSRVGEPAALVFWNRPITVFRSYLNQLSPAERAARASDRLAALPEVASGWKIVANEATSGQYSGVIISVNDNPVFSILTDDLDRESNETLKAASDRATAQLGAALEARQTQRSLPVLLRGIGLSVAATLLLLLLLWSVIRIGRRVLARLQPLPIAEGQTVKGVVFDPHRILRSINRILTKLTGWAIAIVLTYAWLAFVLLRFPYSQPWGEQLGSFLINLFGKLGTGLLRSIPGLFTVVVIFLLTRIVVRIVGGIFRGVEKGDLALPWLHQDTARATRYLVTVLIWIFAVTVAYPYVPGSNTEAFKGISILLGLMVSLGSAGLINQVMSGLVVVYSRALKRGEFVRVGDDIGTVSDVGMLSTKIITRKKEEITIPNAVLVGTRTVNYSRHAADGAAKVGTTLTIGYDVPWRQVHAMLMQAADQTAGVRKDPPPRVWQWALSNFYVQYELEVNLDQPEERVAVLSELHTHIQDAFNEQGVQIMVPAFESQPEQKIFVPKSKWFPNEAEVSTGANRGDQSSDGPGRRSG